MLAVCLRVNRALGLLLLLSAEIACSPLRRHALVHTDAGNTADQIDGGADGGSASSDGNRTCAAGTSCVPGNPCHQGVTICSPAGVASCSDTQRLNANGSVCDDGSVCKDGACVACAPGTACSVAGKPCRVGRIDCGSGSATCVESDNQPDGTSCGGGNVCQAGSCVACSAGGGCTPANPCHQGSLVCAGGAPVCNDTGVKVAAGTACGRDMVCSASATCAGCVAGSACPVAGSACRVGITTCNTGASVCLESGNAQDGISCGTAQVCSGGVCVVCSAGLSCVPTNPCHTGSTVCIPSIGCADGATAVPNGTSCGSDKVCSNGTCVACAAGKTCQPTNTCKLGTTSCTTGISACVEGGNGPNGSACGSNTNMVCASGACVACSAGTSCLPANPCHTGTLSCSTGAATCSDSGTAIVDGSACGSGLVCKTGMCVTCVAGAACQPANECKTGTTSCSTGTSVCVESGNKAAGTSCGAGTVCNNGSCVACGAGGSCTPANACHQGTLSCATGAATCTDTGTAIANGSPCGTANFFCSAGTCVSCTPGLTGCGGNPNPCKVGVTSCATGTSVCVDSTTNKPVGSMCGTGMVCNSSAACAACTAGTACKPSNACHNGAIVCSSGAPVCTDLGTNVADGTNCGPATGSTMFCNGGTCGACTPNASCQPSNPCKNGVVSCATGVPACTETTNKPAGTTSCGAAQVCAAGTQTGAHVCDSTGQCPVPATTTCPSTGCNAAGTACNPPCATGQLACGTSCCAAGQGCCGGICAALNTPTHCGSCTMTCATGVMCLNGTCGCPSGQASCNGGPCVDVLSSPDHCGATCAICSGALSKCASGGCVQCIADTDCPAPRANVCAHAACVNHACTFTAQAGVACPAGGTCSAAGLCVRPLITAGGYTIDATEVTKGQYAAFLQAKAGNTSGQPAVCAWNTTFQPTQEWPPPLGDYDLPVGWVDWCDAVAYCASTGRRLCGKIGGGSNLLDDYANPALSQWMGACVGPSNFGFPYGNTFDATRCNGAGSAGPVAVGKFPTCVGGYPGVFDMAGNLMEWEDSCLVLGTSGATDLCRNRGGSYVHANDDTIANRCDSNNNNARSLTDSSLGFRCCGN